MKHLFLTCLFLLPVVSLAQQLQASESKALLSVSVTNFEDEPREGEVLLFRSQKSGKTVRRITDASGRFEILLPKGDVYEVLYKNYLAEKKYSEIGVPDEEGIMEAELLVKMELDVSEVFELDIHFDVDKATIKSDSYSALDEVAELLQRKPEVRIQIAGHTDSDGSEEHNQELSESRAQAVKAYISARGISAGRMETVGYGESQPLADNASPQGKARNRRTEIRILE